MNKGQPKMYVIVIEDIYEGLSTSVRILCKETEDFTVSIDVHQGLALSPNIFSLAMDEIKKDKHYTR